MWWSRRKALLALVLPALLAGCGYRPLYGSSQGAAPTGEMASIFVDTIPDRHGQILRNTLMTLLTPAGEPVSPRYRLSVNLRQETETYLARRDETATRADIKVWADYTLYQRHPKGEDKAIDTGTIRHVVGYNLPHEEYSSVVNERAAQKTAMVHLAQEIRRRLADHFRRHPPATPPMTKAAPVK